MFNKKQPSKLVPVVKDIKLADIEVEELKRMDGELTDSVLKLGLATRNFFISTLRGTKETPSHLSKIQTLENNLTVEINRILKSNKITNGKIQPPLDYKNKIMKVISMEEPKKESVEKPFKEKKNA